MVFFEGVAGSDCVGSVQNVGNKCTVDVHPRCLTPIDTHIYGFIEEQTVEDHQTHTTKFVV